jgi:hypothetical protein
MADNQPGRSRKSGNRSRDQRRQARRLRERDDKRLSRKSRRRSS